MLTPIVYISKVVVDKSDMSLQNNFSYIKCKTQNM